MSKPEVKFEPILHQEETPPIEYFDLDKKLNRRQQVFVWTIVNNPQMSYVEAAKRSGYKDARQSAYKLMKNENVLSEYKYLMSEVRKKYELNHDRAVKDLYDIRDKALDSGSYNAAIAAQNSLLKVGGLVVDKKEVRFGKIDMMSREEIENRLKQLMGQEIIDVPINDESLVSTTATTHEIDNSSQDDNEDNS
jgi:hypothetical protein|tara:strand:+ start:1092 stop:1670 length:579 start_codon:yes stop_codon:yes gene_type:complete